MIKAYFINLDRSSARRMHIEELARGAGIELQRLTAIDGQQLSDEEFESVHPAKPGTRRMTKSEVACFLSHRRAWEEICKTDGDYGAVFEDDILFGTALSDVLISQSWIKHDMDLIKLDKFTNRRVEFGEGVVVGSGIFARQMLSIHVGCGGYILSKSFARRLLEETKCISIPVDHFLFDPVAGNLKKYRIWQILPSVCLHQHVSSENFLPADAEQSSLQQDRKRAIKSHQHKSGRFYYVLGKLAKELKRPFLGLGNFLYMKAVVVFRGTSWAKVSFQKETFKLNDGR